MTSPIGNKPQGIYASEVSSTRRGTRPVFSEAGRRVSVSAKRKFEAIEEQQLQKPAGHQSKRRKVEPKTVSTTNPASNLNNRIADFEKRTNTTIENQIKLSTQSQSTTHSPLIQVTMIGLRTDLSFIKECVKLNPNSQSFEAFLNWFEKLIAFSEKLETIPRLQNVDTKQLQNEYWSLLYEKFAIPNLFEIYQLYSQDIPTGKVSLEKIKENLEVFKNKYDASNSLSNENKEMFCKEIEAELNPLIQELASAINNILSLKKRVHLLSQARSNPAISTPIQTSITSPSSSIPLGVKKPN